MLSLQDHALKLVFEFIDSGKSQSSLASMLSLPRSTINRWVKKRSKMNYRWALRVISKLESNINETSQEKEGL